MSTPEKLIPALRQYQHNEPNGELFAGFDYAETIKAFNALQAELDQRQWVSVDEAAVSIKTDWPDNDVTMLTDGKNPETIGAEFLINVGASHYAILPSPLPSNNPPTTEGSE